MEIRKTGSFLRKLIQRRGLYIPPVRSGIRVTKVIGNNYDEIWPWGSSRFIWGWLATGYQDNSGYNYGCKYSQAEVHDFCPLKKQFAKITVSLLINPSEINFFRKPVVRFKSDISSEKCRVDSSATGMNDYSPRLEHG